MRCVINVTPRPPAHPRLLHARPLAVVPSTTRPVISPSLFADNRARLVARLRADGSPPARDVVLLAGGETDYRHETDHEKLFRQESFFAWAFGVEEPDCFGAVDVATGAATLFVPRLPPAYAVVMGAIKPPAAFREKYGVDAVAYVDELPAALAGARLLLLRGFNTDGKRLAAPAAFPGDAAFARDTERLWPAITEARVFKSPAEAALLRYVAAVSSEAHLAVMQHAAGAVRAGAPVGEWQLESLFRHWAYYHGGCRHVSYTCICASGPNGAVLHYGHAGEPNARALARGDGCLFDMGAEYACYGADVTTSFPADGVFTPDQRLVYDAVWAAVRAVEDAMAPGVKWPDMQTLAYRVVLTHLRDGGLLAGDVDAMLAVNLGAVFMPHGLGHFLGIDTHDVGGYNGGAPARPAEAGFASLRTTRALEAGMYLTVEPGCYFIDVLLDAAAADPARAPFLVLPALARFRGTGGVRIEDDVLVTATGIENFTRAPRRPEEIEAACAGRLNSINDVTVHRRG